MNSNIIKKKTVVMVSGCFDPLHLGHLRHFQKAKKLGDELVVAMDGDGYIISKKGGVFMPIESRVAIIKELRCVDKVITTRENNVSSIIRKVKPDIIAKGGDRKDLSGFHEKELMVINDLNIKVVFGVEDKKSSKYSSSKLLERWVNKVIK